MPYVKLIIMERFSPLRIKQLFDDARIFVAHYAELSRGKKHFWKTGKPITKQELIKRFAEVRGILWALGYIPKMPEKKSLYRELFILAWPLVKKVYKQYKGKVKKA